MTKDLVSDMLTRIRNASLVKHSFTQVQFSNLNISILRILKLEGYIQNYNIETLENKKLSIKVFLKYRGWWIKTSLFSNIIRISKPGKRVFVSYRNFSKEIDGLKYAQGVAIISTSIGVMSHQKAIELKRGGEVLCYIY